MEIERSKLENALVKVAPGVSQGKEYIEHLKNVTFTGEDLMTYSDHTAVLCPFTVDFLTDALPEISVRFEDLYKLVTKTLKSEIISLELNETNTELILKGGATKGGLAVTVDNEIADKIDNLFAQLPSDDMWNTLPDDFIQGVQLCRFSASGDLTTGLAIIHIDKDGIISSDNLRASWYKFEGKMKQQEKPLLIAAGDVAKLVNFNVKQYYAAESWVHFRTEDSVIFSARLVPGDTNLGKFKQLFKKVDGIKIQFPTDLKEKIDGMVFIADGDVKIDKSLQISMGNGMLTCIAKSQRGWVQQETSVEYTGEPIQWVVNPTFLSQVLTKLTTAIVEQNRTVLEAGCFKHILMHRL